MSEKRKSTSYITEFFKKTTKVYQEQESCPNLSDNQSLSSKLAETTTLNTDQSSTSSQSSSTLSYTYANLNTYEYDPANDEKQAYVCLSMKLGPYQPTNIVFPRSLGRSFRQEWYKMFEWLEYSIKLDSAFCFFRRAFPTVGTEGTFTTSGFKKWGKAIEKFNVHQKSNTHKEAQAKVLGYKQSLLLNSGSIIGLIDKHHSTVVTENREYLKCILETLLYCSKQGIAIRGHDEESESLNKGNFLELLTLSKRQQYN